MSLAPSRPEVSANDDVLFRLKKIGGLGWKSKLVVGWALDREVADGLEIVDKKDNHYIVTAMVLRDELFNRLIAMVSLSTYHLIIRSSC